MECMCPQTRPQFILSSERVLGNEVRTHVNSEGRILSTGGSEEGGTHLVWSHRAHPLLASVNTTVQRPLNVVPENANTSARVKRNCLDPYVT